jgi:hypothetical protein
MRALVEYVQLFRTNDLVIDDIRMCTDENGSNENGNFDGNFDLNGENYSERVNEVNDEFGYSDEKNRDTTIRIFSWNGNKDLVVSLLPDLPLFPYSDAEDVVEGEFSSFFSLFLSYFLLSCLLLPSLLFSSPLTTALLFSLLYITSQNQKKYLTKKKLLFSHRYSWTCQTPPNYSEMICVII